MARSRMEVVAWGFVTGLPSSTVDGRLRIDSPASGATLVASVISRAADQSLPGASGS
jgi:hypothetical protein